MTHGEKLPRIDAKLNVQHVKEWKAKNPDKHHAQEKRWRERNPNYFSEWRVKNAEALREFERNRRGARSCQMQAYLRLYQPKWRARNHVRVREYASKRRGLGSIDIVLNKHFTGSQLHHMGDGWGVYLPKSVHRATSHSLLRNSNMDAVNWDALTWLVSQ